MPVHTIWHESESFPLSTALITRLDVVKATVWVPPLAPLPNAVNVEVHTYPAKWLALLALDRLADAELQLGRLPRAAAQSVTPSEASARGTAYASWVIAMLELVFLYRLHLELVARPAGVRSPWQGKLNQVGATAYTHDGAIVEKIWTRLDEHAHADADAGIPGRDAPVEGTPSECAQFLMGFLNSACKIDAGPNEQDGSHARWLASIEHLAVEVLQFMTQQASKSISRADRRSSPPAR